MSSRSIDRGFYTILGAQFFSALADNALFIAAIAMLKWEKAPDWHQSMLLWCFTVSYVVLAPFAGAFADSMPKGRAMLICNGIKLAGCLAMLFGASPLLAYALVGFGAAAYSPAKYGIVTEYLPHDRLVEANGWLEGATVTAIIFGTVLGGFISGQRIDVWLDTTSLAQYDAPQFAVAILALVYILAGWLNLHVPTLDVELRPIHYRPSLLIREFWECVIKLWRDPQGQVSLGVTTLFWGAGQTMRLVVLNWAIIWLAFSMEQATRLIAIVAFGTVFGAVLAGRFVPLKSAFRVLPAGVAMGVVTILMLWVHTPWLAGVQMFVIGALGGFFVVPLNAMLQHRGHSLMGAGHSIAVQNFNENLGILVMVGVHAMVIKYLSQPLPADINPAALHHFAASGTMPPMYSIVVGFGLFLICTMLLIIRRYRRGVRAGIMQD